LIWRKRISVSSSLSGGSMSPAGEQPAEEAGGVAPGGVAVAAAEHDHEAGLEALRELHDEAGRGEDRVAEIFQSPIWSSAATSQPAM